MEKTIREFYRINAHDEEDFLIENTPEIFYYPIVGENQNYHFEPMGIAYIYEHYNKKFYRLFKTQYFHSLNVEYYILTLNTFSRFHLDSYFSQSYMAAAIGKVLIDLYYLIGEQIRNTDSKMGESFTAALAGKNILSPRELEIVKLASQHKTRKEIATELNIAESTVQTHVDNIGAKTKTKGLKDLRKPPLI